LFGEFELGGRDLWALPLQGSRKPFKVLDAAADERAAVLSPDGKWIAYGSNESGRFEVFVQPFPNSGSGGKWQVSTQGGRRPKWKADGKELFFIGDNGSDLWAAAIRTSGSTIQSDTARQLFHFDPLPFIFSPYDVTPGGDRFLVLQPPPEERASPLQVTLNWHAALKPE
jgi:hypothetical protein